MSHIYDRFTDRARKVMRYASTEAKRFNHEFVSTEHILLGLVKEGSGVAANVLKALGADLRDIRLEVEKSFPEIHAKLVDEGNSRRWIDKVVSSIKRMYRWAVTMRNVPQTPQAQKVIQHSIDEARNFDHLYLGTEHILLGLLREKEDVAARVLIGLGLTIEEVREKVADLLQG